MPKMSETLTQTEVINIFDNLKLSCIQFFCIKKLEMQLKALLQYFYEVWKLQYNKASRPKFSAWIHAFEAENSTL